MKVFISEPINVGWIIEKLMRDLADQLSSKGVDTQIGPPHAYCDQEVVLHARYLYASNIERAKVNSLFVTHIDDVLKEVELKTRISQFNSFICTSEPDADFLCGLGCPPEQVLGLALPHRGGYVRRPRVAFFSERYADARKNEEWLFEYFANRSEDIRRAFVLCMLGYNWESFCERLASLGVSFELYRYDRRLPGEYEAQKFLLQGMNYLIYPGFDGGAMCVYDGITAGLDLVVADNGYHRGLTANSQLFRDKDGFFSALDHIAAETIERERVLSERGIQIYADRLIRHWSVLLHGSEQAASPIDPQLDRANRTRYEKELNFGRSHYKRPSFQRAASFLYRQCVHLLRRR